MSEKVKEGYFLLFLLRGFVGLVTLFPYRVQVAFFNTLIRAFIACSPSYRKIAHKNLMTAFPENDEAWRNDIIKKHCLSLARFLADFFRLPKLTDEWFYEHVYFPQEEEYKKKVKTGNGVMLLTGHIGSFELLPSRSALAGEPMAIVVRSMKQHQVDLWWNNIRAVRGNSTISKKGAFKAILKKAAQGEAIGFLFDQNVTRSNAIFVDWFGVPAATTKALGLVAMRLKVPLIAARIRCSAFDHYELEIEEVKTDDIYNDENLDREEAIRIITERGTRILERFIKSEPADWFWFHRRWRTRPEGEEENFYK